VTDECIRDRISGVGAANPPPMLERRSTMSLFGKSLLASVLALVLADAAHAMTIFTPPVIPDDDGSFFCLVTNVSFRTLSIAIDVLDMNGGTSRHIGFTVPPLETRAAPGHGASNDRVCRIAFDGGRSSIRASVEVLSSSSAIEAVYPVP
jgi:hypothetical protein